MGRQNKYIYQVIPKIKKQYYCCKSVYTWGANKNGELGNKKLGLNKLVPTEVVSYPEADAKFIAVSTGYGHTATVKDDGYIWSCGKNDYGQLNSYAPLSRMRMLTTLVSPSKLCKSPSVSWYAPTKNTPMRYSS